MWSLRCLAAVGLLSLPVVTFAAAPGSVEVTCDVDRTAFRSAARSLPAGGSVTFHVYNAPTGGTATDYVVPAADLQVFKAFTEKFDSVSKRKAARIDARIGDDGNPVMVPADGIAWLALEIGTSTLGCDFAATGSSTARRRLHSVPYARECEECATAQEIADVSVRVSKASATSIPDGTPAGPASYTPLPFDSERFDTAGLHSNTTDNSRLTVPANGKYYIYGNVEWDINATGVRALAIRADGVSIIARVISPPVSGVGTSQIVSTHWEFQAGQYVELVAAQNSGGPLDIVYQPISSQEFGMVKIP